MDVRIVSNIGTSYKSKKTLPIATPESLRKGMLRAEGGEAMQTEENAEPQGY